MRASHPMAATMPRSAADRCLRRHTCWRQERIPVVYDVGPRARETSVAGTADCRHTGRRQSASRCSMVRDSTASLVGRRHTGRRQSRPAGYRCSTRQSKRHTGRRQSAFLSVWSSTATSRRRSCKEIDRRPRGRRFVGEPGRSHRRTDLRPDECAGSMWSNGYLTREAERSAVVGLVVGAWRRRFPAAGVAPGQRIVPRRHEAG
jgi:hypothetical protein